jgi:hypothetical protein
LGGVLRVAPNCFKAAKGAAMKNPKTVDEYIDLVHQAVYEVDELRAIVEDDEDRKALILPWVDAMDRELRKMYDDMISGQYQFDPNGPDLPFMDIVKRFGPHVPFKPLLNVINHTHRFGLDIDSK